MIALPLELVPDPDDSRLVSCFLPVTVDGAPARALLDSGAARSAVVERPGLATHEVRRSGGGVFGQGAGTERRATVEMNLAPGAGGDATVTVEAAVVPRRHAGHGDLIGQDVLRRWCCEYRLGEATLVLGAPPPAHGHPVWVGERGHVMVDVTWPDGTTCAAVLDTGASISIVDAGFAAAHPDLFGPDGAATGTDADGGTRETSLVRIAELTMLGSVFPASPGAVVDLTAANATAERPMQMILGWPLLSRGRFTIDHAAARAAHTPEIPLTGRRRGSGPMEILADRARPLPAPPGIVWRSLVDPHDPAARLWLRLRDDETPPAVLAAEEPTRVTWSSLWPARPDDVIDLELSPRDGGTLLRFSLRAPGPMPDASTLGHLRRRLNELLFADLRLSYGQ